MISSPTVLFHLKVYTYYPPEILRYAFSSLSSSNEDVFSRDSSLRSRMTARENIVVKDLEEKAPLQDDSGRVILSSFRWNKVLCRKQRFAQKSLRRFVGGCKEIIYQKLLKTNIFKIYNLTAVGWTQRHGDGFVSLSCILLTDYSKT